MVQIKHLMREVAANAAMGISAISHIRVRRRRTSETSVDGQARQILDQIAFFMGTLGSVGGKTVAEIGPRDTIALRALLLKAGARRYIAYDRFRGDVFGPAARALYAHLDCSPDPEQVSLR